MKYKHTTRVNILFSNQYKEDHLTTIIYCNYIYLDINHSIYFFFHWDFLKTKHQDIICLYMIPISAWLIDERNCCQTNELKRMHPSSKVGPPTGTCNMVTAGAVPDTQLSPRMLIIVEFNLHCIRSPTCVTLLEGTNSAIYRVFTFHGNWPKTLTKRSKISLTNIKNVFVLNFTYFCWIIILPSKRSTKHLYYGQWNNQHQAKYKC